MEEMQSVYDTYRVIDLYLSSQETCLQNERVIIKQEWTDKRKINDQAFFVILFAKLENRINNMCKRLIIREKNAPCWKDRRWTDIFDVDRLDHIPFMQRAGLLIDKGSHNMRDLEEIYETRCDIAHGDLSSPINVHTKAEDIFRIGESLEE